MATDAPRWAPPVPAGDRNYPMNCWWVAAFSAEVGDALLGRWIVDTPVVLYRTDDGVVALENRCAHRDAPLSLGVRRGDTVECGYHGFTFDPAGACVRIPTTDRIPPTACVRSFPTIERPPYVWIYVGDPDALAEVPDPPTVEWLDDPSYARVTGHMQIAANYLLLKENVLDLSHFGFVHASTFKITDWVNPPQVTTTDDSVTFRQEFRDSPLPGVFAEPLGIEPGTPYDRDNYGSFVSPALQVAAVDVLDRDDATTVVGRFRVLHATTPIDGRSMNYFWTLGRDFGVGGAEMAALEEITEVGFAEDEAVIEAVQRTMDAYPRQPHQRQVSVKADSAGLHARRLVQAWMDRETSET